MEPNADRGTSFEVVSVIFTFFTIVAYSLRVYSRKFLTRSLGSDDHAMFFALLTSTAGQVGAIIQVEHGMGRHRQYISDQDYAITELWATIAWFFVFISFFFLRASIMLFVLRLLPSYKIWQHRVIYVAFILNFLISMLGLISYGIQCIPFTAIWQEQLQATANCYSKDVLVIVNQVNGILSCVIDITTALIPQFLLWNVSMKPKTKRILNIIFALGVLTAATSIGRAASINRGAIENDTNWRLMPSRWWAMFEEKCGIIFACGPALRQLYGYYKRTGTFKPTKHRQPPEQDFVKMRGRITWRDVFWYQKKHAVPSSRQQGSSSYDGSSKTHESHKDRYPVAAAIQGVNRPPSKGDPDVEAAFGGDADHTTRERVVRNEARAHRFGEWQQKFRSMFNTTSGSTAHSDPSSFPRSTEMSTEPQHLEKTSQRSLLGRGTDTSNASYSNNHNTSSNVESRAESIDRSRVSESTNAQQRGSDPTDLYGRRADRDRIGRRYREWGLLPNRGQSSDQPPEARPSGGTGLSETPSRDHELASTLTNPIARPAARLEK